MGRTKHREGKAVDRMPESGDGVGDYVVASIYEEPPFLKNCRKEGTIRALEAYGM